MITQRTVAIPTILEDGQIQLREDTVYEENGQELFRQHHRRVLDPADPLPPGEDARVQAVAQLLWTPSVIAERKQKRAEAQRP